ncbi:MAG: exosortase O [Thiotrichaceae bacterium]|nr:exosortase O [Thiotrichaceae bacterium]
MKIRHITSLFPALMTLLIIIATLVLFHPVFYWLTVKMSLANGYLHIFTLLGLIGLGIYRLSKLSHNPFHFPVWHPVASFIWIPTTILYLFNEANIGFHTLSAVLFILYLYGLSGHFISKSLWRSMLLPMVLMILVLPFEHYLDIYLGFPLRLLSAQWASTVLEFTQLPLITVESILMVDNKAVIVDLDCSGLNSLWFGLIFYLLLTWIERYILNLRWVLMGLTLMILLVVANVFRIVILVMLDLVLGLPEIAQRLHQSLGLLGFVTSCLIIWWMLSHWADKHSLLETSKRKTSTKTHPYVPSLLFIIISCFAFLYQPYQKTKADIVQTPNHKLQLPTQYPLTTAAMTQQEKDFFISNHTQAQKYTIRLTVKDKPIIASMVLVWSRAWKTQHVPENCYLSQGYTLSDQGLWHINPQHNIRYLSLNKTNKQYTGVYWFQSIDRSTPDYSSRVMDNLLHSKREWVMVSILWNQPVTPDEITAFIIKLKQSIENQFHES